jgi:hypothetical protein
MDADKLDELERLLRLATTRPWKANTADKTGEDWLICSLGNSNEDGQDWIVTTDRIHASELDGDAKFDAALIVAAINALPELVAMGRRANPEFIAAVIRRVDGNNKMGAGQLGDLITDAILKGTPT